VTAGCRRATFAAVILASPRSPRLLAGLLLLWLSLAACGDAPADPPRVFGGSRPVTLQVPPQLDEGRDYRAFALSGDGELLSSWA
jgi:hypothetical protein